MDYSRRIRTFFGELRRRQRETENFGPIIDSTGILSQNWTKCLENWANFYTSLYKEKVPTSFNPPYRNNPILDAEFSIEEVILAINTLKDHKAPGEDNILNNDLTILLHTDPEEPQFAQINRELLQSIHEVLSSFWTAEKVPSALKKSILRPFLKDSDKDSTDPENYRPISLLNTLMKLYEGMIKRRLVHKLENENLLAASQAAYRKFMSTSDQIFVLQELIFEYRFCRTGIRGGSKPPLYICFMDLRKAFDTVSRDIMLRKLYALDITGKMFRVIKDLYSNNSAAVLVENRLSRVFKINAGVMQGSKLGPILFNIFINDLLKELEESNLGASIWNIKISTLGFADDIVLISDNKRCMQKLVDICQSWAAKNGMEFSATKCKAMVFNRPPNTIRNKFRMGNKPIEVVQEYKYLGILLSTKRLTNIFSKHFSKAIEKAERRIQCIRHLGYHADGLRIETAIRMYKILVRPILEYCSQVLIYRNYYYSTLTNKRTQSLSNTKDYAQKLEHFQTQALKKLLNCPKHIPPSIVRLFAGVEPLIGRLDLLKLRYFWKLSNIDKNSVSNLVYKFRRKRFLNSNKGFLHEVFNLCCKYNKISIWHGICPGKINRVKINPLSWIKKIVIDQNLAIDLQTAKGKSSAYSSLFLKGIFSEENDFKKYRLGKLFQNIGLFASADARKRFVKALLTTNPFPQLCKFCQGHFRELLQHQLRDCQDLRNHRRILQMEFILYTKHGVQPIINWELQNMLSSVIQDKLLLRCFTNFLLAVDF